MRTNERTHTNKEASKQTSKQTNKQTNKNILRTCASFKQNDSTVSSLSPTRIYHTDSHNTFNLDESSNFVLIETDNCSINSDIYG